MIVSIKERLEELGLLDREKPLDERLYLAIKDPLVRKVLEFSTPQVQDITKYLPINSGKVYAVRNDLNSGVPNHKKQVTASLILRGILTRRLSSSKMDTLIDGGSYNTASSLKYYSDKFEMKGIYMMSSLFTEDILSLLRSDNFSVIQAPHKQDSPREREFYSYLYEKMKDREFKKDKFCLWHAKYGGQSLYPLGKELAETVPNDLTHIVSCLGSGTTLEGTQIPIQDHFSEKGIASPKILISEHELSPLFSRKYPHKINVVERMDFGNFEEDSRKFSGIPHDIIGPHFDEINPLLKQASINRVNGIIQYSDNDWKSTQKYLASQGLHVGNSSAANINVATRLAREGNNVLTVIFEPFREFYRRKDN
ncbi:MAG: pyridoxal-phosphate dependent enzyme [Nanoarchaeota archaeon]